MYYLPWRKSKAGNSFFPKSKNLGRTTDFKFQKYLKTILMAFRFLKHRICFNGKKVKDISELLKSVRRHRYLGKNELQILDFLHCTSKYAVISESKCIFA